MPELHRSICRACVNFCGVLVETQGNRILSVKGDPEDPVYQGYSCPKGRNHWRAYQHPDRLLGSRKRAADGSQVPIGTDQALDEIADRIAAIIERHGPRALAVYAGSWWYMDHPANLAVGEAFMKAVGSKMFFTATTIDQAGRFTAKGIHGQWLAPGPIDPDVLLIVGNNPIVSHQGPCGSPGAFMRDFRNQGGKLIVVDPRRTETAFRADLHLQIRPGSDAALFAGLIRVILSEGLEDAEFLRENVSGVEELRAAVEPFTPAEVSRLADVPAEEVVAAARMFAATHNGRAMAGTGTNMSGHATLVEYLLLCLETICGHWLREGAPVPNAVSVLPSAGQPAMAQALDPFPAWGFGEPMRVRGLGETLAGMPTAALAEEILLDGEGQVRALLSLGGNPVISWPDQRRTVEAFGKLELFVQSDVTMSASAATADYVLASKFPYEMPATSFLSDLFAMIAWGPRESYAAYTPALVDPPEGSDVTSHWRMLYRIARRLGLALDVPAGISYATSGGITTTLDMDNEPTDDELIAIVQQGSRVSLDEIKGHEGARLYPDPPVVVAGKAPGWEGRLCVGNADMMRDLTAMDHEQEPDLEFPFRMTSRRSPHVFNTPSLGTIPNRPRHNPAHLHPDDMERLGIADGDRIAIRSSRATVVTVAAADDTLRPGIVSLSHGHGGVPDSAGNFDLLEVGVNSGRLIANDEAYDRYSGQPRMSNVPVAVSRVASEEDLRAQDPPLAAVSV